MLLATKLKNLLSSAYTVKLRNILINGDKRGCSGFIQNDGRTVYVTTEPCGSLGFMFRTAKHDKDYEGGRNQWAKTVEELLFGINRELSNS